MTSVKQEIPEMSFEIEKDPLEIIETIKVEASDNEESFDDAQCFTVELADQESIDGEFLDEEFLEEEFIINDEFIGDDEIEKKYDPPSTSKSRKRSHKQKETDNNKKLKHFWVKPERLEKQSIEYKDLKSMLADYNVSNPFLDEEIFCELLAHIRSDIKRQDTTMRLSIKPEERLAASLSFLTTLQSFKQISERTKRVSTAYLSCALWDVCASISQHLKNNFFQFPDSKESWQKVANEFEQKYNFPCLGVLGAKHIRFQATKTEIASGEYNDLDGKKSIYLIMLIDAFGKFLYIDVGPKGSLSFKEALEQTDLITIINNPEKYFPNTRKVGNFQIPYGFVANEQFVAVSKVLTPCLLNSNVPTVAQSMLNEHIAKLNASLETFYKIFRTHLGAMEKTSSFNRTKAIEIVRCCCMLHNFMITKQNPFYKIQEGPKNQLIKSKIQNSLLNEHKLLTLLDEELFDNLLEYIKSDKECQQDTKIAAWKSVEERLAINLSFFSSYETISLLAQKAQVQPDSMRKILLEFCCSITRNLKKDYLQIPNTKNDWLTIANSFEQKFDFPCLGVLLGKRIPFLANDYEMTSKEFTDYYGSNSFYLFMLIDAFNKIRFIDIGQNGSLSFEKALHQSNLWKFLKNSNKYFPSAKHIGGFKLPYVIVTNELFENIPELLTPYRSNAQLTKAEQKLNEHLSQLNENVENIFETMKFHLKAIRKTISFNRLQAIEIIRCCCLLHNYFKTKQNSLYTEQKKNKIKNQNILKLEKLDLIQKRRILRDAFRNYYNRYKTLS